MRKIGELAKIPVYVHDGDAQSWCIVKTTGRPGDDEQFYVVDSGGNVTRYAVPEVLMLADWYRAREKERASLAAAQTTEIQTPPKGGKR